MRIIWTVALVPAALHSQVPVDLDRSGDGYPIYRIPALVVTTAGTLIAAYDGRPAGADLPANIALIVRRSLDGGTTWGPRLLVRADTAPFGFGDPSLLVDHRTGRIFLFHAASVRRGFFNSSTGLGDDDPDVLHADVSWSDDDGLTWQHRRLTSMIKQPGWAGLFAASGAGIQLRHGPHAGRLVQQFTVRRGGDNYAVSVMSDDGGATWRAGALVGPGLDENKSVELHDGSLLLNSRARPHRLVARSIDGGATWSRPVPDPRLPDPANNGAIIRYDVGAAPDDPRARWLLFTNTADSLQRRNLTVRLSCDGGRTWPGGRTVDPGPAGYSTLVILPTGEVGLLFERGRYEAISFVRFPLATIGMCH